MAGLGLRRSCWGWVGPLFLAAGLQAREDPHLGALVGRVVSGQEPLAETRVFIYRTVERSIRQAVTGEDGAFRFLELPLGLYKVVAYKPGFVPEVALFLLERAATGTLQLELRPQEDPGGGGDYWRVRSEIPADVLREMMGLLPIMVDSSVAPATSKSFITAMTAVTGVESSDGSSTAAQLSAGSVEVGGRVGDLRLAVQGNYRMRVPQLPAVGGLGTPLTAASRLSVSLETPLDSSWVLDTASRSWEYGPASAAPSDGEHSQVELRYRKQFGSSARADLRAGYEAFRGWAVPGISELSWAGDSGKSLWLDARLATHGSDPVRWVAGLKVEETTVATWGDRGTRTEPQWNFEGFGGLEWQPDSAWLVRYGLLTRLGDGSLEFSPQGSALVRFGSGWQAGLEGSWRLPLEETPVAPLRTASLSALGPFPCRGMGGSCVQIRVEHAVPGQKQFVTTLSWREVSAWTRLLWTDSLVPQGEGLLLFPGDLLSGLEVELGQRFGSSWEARWIARYVAGGQGATGPSRPGVENQLAWWASGLALHYLPWSSGFYLSAQRIDQAVASDTGRGRQVRSERLEFVVTQDLTELLALARDWSLRLGLELSRGASLLEPILPDSTDVRQRLTTGFAVRF